MSAATDVSGIAALATGPLGGDDLKRLRSGSPKEVAQEFEAMLFAQMIAAMRRTVTDSGLLSSSPERRVLDGVFDHEIARSLVKQVDLGLARQIAAQGGEKADGAAHAAAIGAAGEPVAKVRHGAAEYMSNARLARLPRPGDAGREVS